MIKNEISLDDARALLSIAVCEVCDFFNVGKNMNDTQIAMTVDLILESYWHLHLEEVKYCFRRAMRRERLYDRLDGNIIIGWLRDYDNERTEEAMRLSDQEASEEENAPVDRPEAVSFQQYLDQLRQRAETDPQAADLLATCDRIQSAPSSADRSKRDHDFKMWRTFKYLSGNKE